MCGIVGMAGDVTLSQRACFHDMLLVCQMRGRDSTGAIRVTYQGTAETAKAVGTPEYLLGTKRYDTAIDSYGKAYIGHCRARTYGIANYENAHPFSHGDLTGVHNGSLRSWHGMPGAKNFGTDSEWLYWWASEEGMENVLPEIDFCGALVWWDDSDDTLNFYKNDERTLWVTYSEDLKTMLWASEFWMFGPYSRKNKLWTPGEGQTLYTQMETGKIFSYKINNTGRTPKDIFSLSVKEVKTKEREVRGHSGNVQTQTGNRGNGGRYNHGGQNVGNPFTAARHFLGRMVGQDNSLDDDLPTELLPAPQATTKTQEESGTTSTSGRKSSKSSSNVLDFRMGSKDSKSGRKPTLSLTQKSSKNSQQASKDVTVVDFVGCSDALTKAQAVSFRTVAGIQYVSCKLTSREWSFDDFDRETEGICSFCNAPIGDMKEVHRIFVRRNTVTHEEEVSFLCTECVKVN